MYVYIYIYTHLYIYVYTYMYIRIPLCNTNAMLHYTLNVLLKYLSLM